MAHFVLEAGEKGDWVLSGNEGVASVHIHAQTGCVVKVEHLRHVFWLGGVVAVWFDVDDHVVANGRFQHLTINPFHILQRLRIGQAFRLEHMVRGVDVAAARQIGPAD